MEEEKPEATPPNEEPALEEEKNPKNSSEDNKDVEEEDDLDFRRKKPFNPTEEQMHQPHKFWDTQPVPKLSQAVVPITQVEQRVYGPLNPPMSVDDVRDTPYPLAAAFQWIDIDIMDQEWAEKVYTLLLENYVEDDDNMFRFDYSIPFLRWALTPEGYRRDLHVGVIVQATGKLVGFITGIPAKLNVYDNKIDVVEINFLCVHKQLRTKRLAPVLIKEITRRTNRMNIWQAVYTAGIVLPSPISQCTYYHRSLNPKKLIDIGFSRMGRRMNMSRTIRLYKLPEEPQIRGLRPMSYKDIPEVAELLNNYLSKFSLWMDFSHKEVEHFFLPQDDVIYTYVVVDPDTGSVTDLCSFYSLSSSILKHPKHTKLKAAYSFYNVPGAHTLKELFNDLLILAKHHDFDVFNALDAMENPTIFKDLRFGIGDGNLQFYLYNWGCEQMASGKVGLILV